MIQHGVKWATLAPSVAFVLLLLMQLREERVFFFLAFEGLDDAQENDNTAEISAGHE